MGFCINLGSWGDIFAVPKEVVDKHIKLANVLQLKTLLYVLRHSGEVLDTASIAKALSKHPDDVCDSLQYWIENGILQKISDDIIAPATNEKVTKIVDKKSKNVEDNKSIETIKPMKSQRTLSRPQKPDTVFLAKRIKESQEIADLMQEAQIVLGKPISTADSATILMLHDTDGLPSSVILMLMQYAADINKNSMRYIEKLGIKWADEEIDTVEKAEAKIRSLDENRKAWKQVVRIMGINYHSPTANETKFSNRWINEWKFSSDMIREAYERCVDNTGKVTMSYINKILDSWNKKDIRNIDEAKQDKKITTDKKIKEKSASYDIEEYENTSIFD